MNKNSKLVSVTPPAYLVQGIRQRIWLPLMLIFAIWAVMFAMIGLNFGSECDVGAALELFDYSFFQTFLDLVPNRVV